MQYQTGNHLPCHTVITDVNDWYIQLEEEFSCDNKEQWGKREFEIMRNISTLNRTLKYYDKFENPSKLPPKISKSDWFNFSIQNYS